MMNLTLVIAEAGVNHNGNLGLAFQLIEAPERAGGNRFIQLLDQFSERFSNRTWIIPPLGCRNYLSALRLFEVSRELF